MKFENTTKYLSFVVELLMSVVTNDKYSVVSKENAVGTLLSIFFVRILRVVSLFAVSN